MFSGMLTSGNPSEAGTSRRRGFDFDYEAFNDLKKIWGVRVAIDILEDILDSPESPRPWSGKEKNWVEHVAIENLDECFDSLHVRYAFRIPYIRAEM
ncbi:hypothetical protein CEK25_012549 [Fusarium fujikuroi]|nr:hypothetical protein CEK25_012549 [Fusarium fujikuroi]